MATQARPASFVLAYNLGNFPQRLALPHSICQRSVYGIQVELIKTGAKVVHHARQIVFRVAEVATPKDLFAGILQ